MPLLLGGDDVSHYTKGNERYDVMLQLVADDGVARLLVLEAGSWRVAATYD